MPRSSAAAFCSYRKFIQTLLLGILLCRRKEEGFCAARRGMRRAESGSAQGERRMGLKGFLGMHTRRWGGYDAGRIFNRGGPRNESNAGRIIRDGRDRYKYHFTLRTFMFFSSLTSQNCFSLIREKKLFLRPSRALGLLTPEEEDGPEKKLRVIKTRSLLLLPQPLIYSKSCIQWSRS